MRRLFRNIHPNLKTYDENVSIFQLKQLSTLNPPPPLPPHTMLVQVKWICNICHQHLQHMTKKRYANCE